MQALLYSAPLLLLLQPHSNEVYPQQLCLGNVPWPAFKRFFVNARTKMVKSKGSCTADGVWGRVKGEWMVEGGGVGQEIIVCLECSCSCLYCHCVVCMFRLLRAESCF